MPTNSVHEQHARAALACPRPESVPGTQRQPLNNGIKGARPIPGCLAGDVSPEEVRWRGMQQAAAGQPLHAIAAEFSEAVALREKELRNLHGVRRGRQRRRTGLATG